MSISAFVTSCSYSDILLMFHSLGMKDSWGPLKALAVASVINGIGDVLLCSYLGYGIAGAAWATMASQVCWTEMLKDHIWFEFYHISYCHIIFCFHYLVTGVSLGCCRIYDD